MISLKFSSLHLIFFYLLANSKLHTLSDKKLKSSANSHSIYSTVTRWLRLANEFSHRLITTGTCSSAGFASSKDIFPLTSGAFRISACVGELKALGKLQVENSSCNTGKWQLRDTLNTSGSKENRKIISHDIVLFTNYPRWCMSFGLR